ncbi:TerC family protein [Bdellovibrio bacteriovorus]|uniref:Putative transport protein n=1 Tax=Bdellovibrio bacteriovorus (strain ATCC 15356 / DSM 50701 / NCIMB 9529 / HD100) TaxID=264462 RepID=Q6MIS2_BDEBA|nr:TerC family protein [Bdellovibrio bacteriovorus]AHZ83469.1 membrane protein [Bdellovibrio bacteriovorus]BEV69439.1 Putative membrane-bound redox modulator Alx [Bdellovibrio bacteriovorus]CAE80841.1 putative transport protein [Bdellovibrio bacteriovorus HD100]
MSEVLLFPFAEYWWFYAGFIAFVIGMLALDLGVFHKHSHTVSFKEATIWSIVWVSIAMLFNVGLYYYTLHLYPENPAIAKQVGLEFLTGYVIEKSLSIDNIFVFVVVFGFFSIPPKYQHRVLFYGILGALIFRAIFIALGSVLMQYQAVVLIFGVFLIFTGIKMMFQPDKEVDPSQNWLIKWLKKHIRVADRMHEDHFFIKENGVKLATPLFIALVFLEFTDIIFAVDSVPAIFAITKEPMLVFTSNIFAILGLRSLYFLLAGVVDKFHLLKYGLALTLVFVGLKMVWLNKLFGGHFPIGISLGIIFAFIGGSIAASLMFPKKES